MKLLKIVAAAGVVVLGSTTADQALQWPLDGGNAATDRHRFIQLRDQGNVVSVCEHSDCSTGRVVEAALSLLEQREQAGGTVALALQHYSPWGKAVPCVLDSVNGMTATAETSLHIIGDNTRAARMNLTATVFDSDVHHAHRDSAPVSVAAGAVHVAISVQGWKSLTPTTRLRLSMVFSTHRTRDGGATSAQPASATTTREHGHVDLPDNTFVDVSPSATSDGQHVPVVWEKIHINDQTHIEWTFPHFVNALSYSVVIGITDPALDAAVPDTSSSAATPAPLAVTFWTPAASKAERASSSAVGSNRTDVDKQEKPTNTQTTANARAFRPELALYAVVVFAGLSISVVWFRKLRRLKATNTSVRPGVFNPAAFSMLSDKKNGLV